MINIYLTISSVIIGAVLARSIDISMVWTVDLITWNHAVISHWNFGRSTLKDTELSLNCFWSTQAKETEEPDDQEKFHPFHYKQINVEDDLSIID